MTVILRKKRINTNLLFKKWQAFEKCQNRPFAEAIVRQIRQNWSTLLLNFKDKNTTKNDPKHILKMFYWKKDSTNS